ncbi:MAG: ComEC/Rec2 family competence protein [Clostridia bacterium]|nr:ComEC/Rec2 family competence protein [Clostridia bacterium]
MKSRFVNLRFPVIVACFLALGILTGYLFIFYKIDLIWLLAIVPAFAVLLTIFSVLRKNKLLVFTAIILVVYLTGTFNCFTHLNEYQKTDVTAEQTYHICGTVTEKNQSNYGEYIIIKNATADNVKLGGKIRVTLSNSYGEYCDVGYRVEFEAVLHKYDLFPYGELNYYTQNDVKYHCSVYENLKSDYGFTLLGSIRSRLHSTLYDNIDDNTAAICYGMLIGDTSEIDDEALTSFRYGGVAHIFAVSGLHIGLVYGILGFILKKLKANKYLSAGIQFFAILFYSALCGFTLSSIRAVIMCSVAIVTKLLHFKRDGLNTLSAAVFIILIVNPQSLFAVGFQLSVCAVGGIILFANKINALLRKIKIAKRVSKGIAVSIGATAGTLPISAASFGYISGAGFLLNIVLLPLLSILFEIIFIVTIICAIIPPIDIILQYTVLPLEAMLSFLLSAGFEKALITGLGGQWFILFYNIAALSVSDKFNLKFLPQAALFAFTVLITAFFVIIQSTMPDQNSKIIVSASNSNGYVLFKSSHGNILLIDPNASTTQVVRLLDKNYAMQLDGIIILGGENSAVNYDFDLGCDNVYLSDLYIPIQPYSGVRFHYEHNFELCGIIFEFYDGYTVKAVCDGVTVYITNGDIPNVSCDLLISKNMNYDFEKMQKICDADNTVYFSQKSFRYNIYEYGSMSFNISNGKLIYHEPTRH